jgi:hypothetical protein
MLNWQMQAFFLQLIVRGHSFDIHQISLEALRLWLLVSDENE